MTAWNIFIYRLPQQPSRARVAVWRELRRIGSLPLGQSVIALPDLGELTRRLDAIEARVAAEEGVSWRFRLEDLDDAEERRLRDEWNALRAHEYAEIVEECRTKFEREIEFEIFRGNLTAGEAEEIEADLDKIKSWFARVRERDWFDAGQEAAKEAIDRCEQLLQDFLERVYLAESQDGPSVDPPLDLPWGEMGGADGPSDVVPLPRPGKPRRRRSDAAEEGTA